MSGIYNLFWSTNNPLFLQNHAEPIKTKQLTSNSPNNPVDYGTWENSAQSVYQNKVTDATHLRKAVDKKQNHEVPQELVTNAIEHVRLRLTKYIEGEGIVHPEHCF